MPASNWTIPPALAHMPPISPRRIIMDNRNDLWRHVDASKQRFIELSDRVWGMPEVCYTEQRSVAEHSPN
jgi:hypothetical protein